jgi:hypothetical protein
MCLIEATGCHIVHIATRENLLKAQVWLDQTFTPIEEQEAIRDAWSVELAGGAATGMNPTVRRDGIGFTHYWDLFVATVPGNMPQ